MLRFFHSLKLRRLCTKSRTSPVLRFFLLDLRPYPLKVEKKQILAERFSVYPCFWKDTWLDFKLIVEYYFLRDFKLLLMFLIFKY